MNKRYSRRRFVLGVTAGTLAVASTMASKRVSAFAQAATPSADGATLTVIHAQGETVVKRNPSVVLSFDLASVDTLNALGIKVAGLPKSNLAGSLAEFNTDDYLNIGTLFEPDYETVASAAPDLIIVAGRSAAAYPELSKIAPTIDLTAKGEDLIADLTSSTLLLAMIFGKEEEASNLLAEINTAVAELQASTADIGTGLVIMTSGGKLTALVPGGNRGGLIYSTLNIAPPVDDLEAATHGEAISFEFLLEHNPDWLFVIDRDVAVGSNEGEAAEQVLDNALMHETTAWKNDQIIYLDPYDWYIVMGGLTTTRRMIEELQAEFSA